MSQSSPSPLRGGSGRGVIGPVVGLLSPWLMSLYLGTLGVYLGAITLACAGVVRKTDDLRIIPWLPLVFVTIHLGAGWGTLSEAVAGLVRITSAGPVATLEPRQPTGAGEPRVAA